jgi:FkbM family methyltransferase
MRYFNLIKNIKNWWLYLLFKSGLEKREPLLFKARNGIFIEVPLRLLHTFKEIWMEECYMYGSALKISRLAVFIDIGANAGYFSLYAASRFPGAKILAYDPIPPNFEQLRRNININKNSGIIAFQKAVAGYRGMAMMTFDKSDAFSTIAHITNVSGPDNKSDTIEVNCVTLKDIFDDNNLVSCDFLKMDCEGAESEIIFNCPVDYLSRIKQFAIEMHGDAAPLKKYLRDNGFITHETKRSLGMLYAWKV